MTFIAKLRANQKAVADQIAATDRLCGRPTPPDAGLLSEARWALVRLLMEHVSFEEKAIFAPLEEHPDPRLRAYAREIRESQLTFNNGLVAHAQKWTAEAVQKNWADYRRAIAATHRSILDRTLWEVEVLFPLEAHLDSGGLSAAKHNWVRSAWLVKDAMASH